MPDEPLQPQVILDKVLKPTLSAFAAKLAEQGDADRTRRLPDLMARWKDVIERGQYPVLYPPKGFDADEDLRLEQKIHQDHHGKPLTEAEAIGRVENYVGRCAEFMVLLLDATASRDAAIRQAKKLNLHDDLSALTSFQPDCLTHDAGTLNAALQAARKIVVAVDAMDPAPAAPSITREDASRRLSEIRARVLSMRDERLTDHEKMHKRLRVQQSEAMKVYRSAVRAGLLTSIITPIPEDLVDDESFPWHWRKLAEAIHADRPDRIPSVAVLEHADSMPEWLNHAEQLIGALIDLLRDAQDAPEERVMLSPGEQLKALKLKDGDSQEQLKIVGKVRDKARKMGLPLRIERRGRQYFADASDWSLVAAIFAIQLNATKNDKRAWDAFNRIGDEASFVCRECFIMHRRLPANSESCPTCGGKLQPITRARQSQHNA